MFGLVFWKHRILARLASYFWSTSLLRRHSKSFTAISTFFIKQNCLKMKCFVNVFKMYICNLEQSLFFCFLVTSLVFLTLVNCCLRFSIAKKNHITKHYLIFRTKIRRISSIDNLLRKKIHCRCWVLPQTFRVCSLQVLPFQKCYGNKDKKYQFLYEINALSSFSVSIEVCFSLANQSSLSILFIG